MSRRGTWPRQPLAERLLSRYTVDEETGCWLWTGNINSQGYGLILPNGSNQRLRAHRAMYELLVGPIPEGLTLDHLCHSADASCVGGSSCQHRRCVNPAHLEPVTRGENVRRGAPPKRTHCPKGHPYDEANTYRRKSGGRVCRTCGRSARRAVRS